VALQKGRLRRSFCFPLANRKSESSIGHHLNLFRERRRTRSRIRRHGVPCGAVIIGGLMLVDTAVQNGIAVMMANEAKK
jgi:hypothetical protein